MSEERYQEIMRRIQAYQAQNQQRQGQLKAEQILDLLNVVDVLYRLRERIPRTYHFGGVRTHATADGANSLMWLYPAAFQQYQTIWLVGVWVKEPHHVYIGYKSLSYGAPIFNPESYYRLMPKDYHAYYPDTHQPPLAAHVIEFAPQDRLALRQQVETTLSASVQALLTSLHIT